ncbi:hypothetical protein HDU67_001195 [Dinochytrium kinnereticum]|nr:hypothetical protein HDU67_001195 [Dinochytrium kinnereticum]
MRSPHGHHRHVALPTETDAPSPKSPPRLEAVAALAHRRALENGEESVRYVKSPKRDAHAATNGLEVAATKKQPFSPRVDHECLKLKSLERIDVAAASAATAVSLHSLNSLAGEKRPLSTGTRPARTVGSPKRTEEAVVSVSLQDASRLAPFDHLVAGHKDSLFIIDDTTLAKPSTTIEERFYRCTVGTALEEFVPSFYGVREHCELMRKVNTPEAGEQSKERVTILIENVLGGLVGPCIADVKIGVRLYGDDASPEKIERMKVQAEITTSAETGLRICGMKLYSPSTASFESFGKEYGRSLTTDTLGSGFSFFFSRAKNPKKVVRCLQKKTLRLIEALKGVECRMFASSLLVAYEAEGRKRLRDTDNVGEGGGKRVKVVNDIGPTSLLAISERFSEAEVNESLATSETSSVGRELQVNVSSRDSLPSLSAPDSVVDDGNSSTSGRGRSDLVSFDTDASESAPASSLDSVGTDRASNLQVLNDDDSDTEERVVFKLIDFAHAHFEAGIGPDEGAIFGLSNLLKYLEEVLQGL